MPSSRSPVRSVRDWQHGEIPNRRPQDGRFPDGRQAGEVKFPTFGRWRRARSIRRLSFLPRASRIRCLCRRVPRTQYSRSAAAVFRIRQRVASQRRFRSVGQWAWGFRDKGAAPPDQPAAMLFCHRMTRLQPPTRSPRPTTPAIPAWSPRRSKSAVGPSAGPGFRPGIGR